MRDSFTPYWPRLVEYEGSTLDLDPHDSGNWTGGKIGVGDLKGTRYGIDAASHPGEDIAGMTPARAQAIYLESYAKPVHFDELPAGVDVAVLDPAINNGVSRATKFLQTALGSAADGTFGILTGQLATVCDPIPTVKKICSIRMGFNNALAPRFDRYKKGWATRVAKCEAFCVDLANKFAGMSAKERADELTHEAENVAVERNSTKAGGQVCGGAAGAATGAAQAIPHGTWVYYSAMGLCVLAGLLAVAYFIHWTSVHKARASAYAEAAVDLHKEATP